jgi:myo-inositol 2-dehydrogenase/D-chiro-inositol 1-dehydrogenase
VQAKPPYQDFFLERYSVAYRAELSEFIKLARGQESTSPTFADGRAALVLADAAARSAVERVSVSVEL